MQPYYLLWKYVYEFHGNCMKRRVFSPDNDPEEIERRDEYMGYGIGRFRERIYQVFPYLGKSFRITKCSQPNFLKLYFTGLAEFADPQVKIMTKVMRASFACVEGLVLDLRCCQNITDVTIEHISSKIIRNFSHLKHLRLNLHESFKVSEKAFMMLVQDISNCLPNLAHLFLNFAICKNIGNQGVEFFAYHISRKLTKLAHLKFDFYGCNINEKGLTNFYKEIGKRLINLKFLEIHHLKINHLTDDTLKVLEDNIIKKLSGLKHLSLRIGPALNISSKAFESLFFNIGKHLSGLIFLNVEFLKCENINDENVRTMLTMIHEKCKDLTHVKLHFEEFPNIKGTALFPNKQTATDYCKQIFVK